MASEKNLALKKETVSTIVDKIKNSESVILFTYQGLTVSDVSSLRRKLREENAEVKIYKNTLLKRAFEELKLDLDEFLAGPNAILFSSKLLEAIKVLTEFAKDHECLKIRAGIIKGDVVSIETIKEYATIPSMEGLLNMLAGGMIEHVKNLSISLNLYAEKLNDGKPVEEPKEEKVETTPEEPKEEVQIEEKSAEETPAEETSSEPEVQEETVTEEVAEEPQTEENQEPTEEQTETKEEN